MPKFPKAFARRKSTANALDDMVDSPTTEPSFKVFERPNAGAKSFDGGVKFAKMATAPTGRPRTSHLENDNMFANLGNNRGSGASNTNTASTTDDSSRMSAASTTPSSTDLPGRDEWRSSEKHHSEIPLPSVAKSSSAFSLKNAGRSLSWGRSKPSTPSVPKDKSKDLPTLPVDEDISGGRSRAVTASSYASTATPPKLDERDLGLSLGGDFSDMFSGLGNRKSAGLNSGDSRALSSSPEMLPSGPAIRNRLNQPSPLNIAKTKGEIEESPYSWSSQHSHEGLISNSSPPFSTHRDSPPPVPQHRARVDSPIYSRSELPPLSESGIRRSSGNTTNRQSSLGNEEGGDEDVRLLRESVNLGRRLGDTDYNTKVRGNWADASGNSFESEAARPNWRAGSVETTPKASKKAPQFNASEDNMFDSQIAASAFIADRFQVTPPSPADRKAAPLNKVMTPAQFERYKHDQERHRSVYGPPKDEVEDEEEENYDDDEDEVEKNRQIAKQRRKQEAHMAVYRQQMMKVTGDSTPIPGLRPAAQATQSSPNILEASRPEENEEEDEEVPLAILQAHGFPNKTRPPMRSMGSNPNLRATGQSAGLADGRLPVFARNLPQDPYVGAGLQNQMHREPMALGGGAGSVSGSPARGLPPGGLVGVIATEERSRAMRRGSPNNQGEYGPPTPSATNGMGMPNMRNSTAGSMYNGMGAGPMGPMGPGNPMIMTPGDQAQMQMQQMQQFMQMQMQFMQMMTSGPGPQGNGQVPTQGESLRPNSSQHLRPGSSHQIHQRAMTMMDPNAAPWMSQGGFAPSIHHQGGYAPSIAPSERSNVGLPGRYRPVSQAVNPDTKSRTSTMSGALQGWENKQSPTIRQVKKPGNVSDEDDEEGWEEMAKKRQKKKSMWKSKRDTSGFQDMLNFTH